MCVNISSYNGLWCYWPGGGGKTMLSQAVKSSPHMVGIPPLFVEDRLSVHRVDGSLLIGHRNAHMGLTLEGMAS